MSDLKSAIHPEALDLVLDSASNASQKGQSQYSTPSAIAVALAADLPAHRPVVIDLTCGPGQLLAGAANRSTEYLLGLDVDPRASGKKGSTALNFHFIHGDLTALYEPMRQIGFRADCFTLNPPWSLAWHAERLEGLADSEVPAVAKTFKAIFLPQTGGEASCDSTIATLMIALDRLTAVGEGLLIGYTKTLERLIFASDAVGSELVRHIWKRVPLPAGPWGDEGMATAIYFSANHDTGPTADGQPPRFMERANGYNIRRDTVNQWAALRDKAASLLPDARVPYHLSLTAAGTLHVRLGLFDTALTKINGEVAQAAKRLSELHGRNPLQVVMQRDERNFILGLINSPAPAAIYPWRVDPALREAVQSAVNAYNAIRAPLAPLPKIQRLGYLDESDDILCEKTLERDGVAIFWAGIRYRLSTQSVRFTRSQFKANLRGEEEELELSGQELAIFIESPISAEASPPPKKRQGKAPLPATKPFCFMDGALREDNVKINNGPGADFIHFTVQDLADHFEIPEVPDIATTDPARHQHFVSQLRQLEQLTA